MSLWLVGAGEMAQEYAKTLRYLDCNFKVIGRKSSSANKFEKVTGIAVRRGGLGNAIEECGAPKNAIVAVGVEQLAAVTIELIESGARRILLEKPGGLNTEEIRTIYQLADKKNASVLVAYNRRFYASTAMARRLIVEDGGATSCTFEFTEWSHVIAPLTKGAGVKDMWFLANSTHVVDLAFHLCGVPKDWHSWCGGSLSWHPSGARYCGAGITEDGVFFSYHADWEAPGRWGVEVLTRKRRFIFRPMEQLQVVSLGSVSVDQIKIDDRLDRQFKPGLYRQTKSFLEGDDTYFCTMAEHLQRCVIYDEIAHEH